ncbi:CYTH domain-containing protein [Rhizobium sp. NFR07]|uniref:CYTH domain-containing protein n=1 Tax=Rhizobium sp. NFR07 TaxID=1566262 RepID=UPI0008E19D6C|nr:CYTH domain-containing protein [Rhizobium sp. NFR07]SFB59188.1 CYTH domain-containing protein [Rhizobium sp. NFR07]
MALEVERKYLVVNDTWRGEAAASRHIEDHLIARFEGGKARVRLCEDQPTLTLKGERHGAARSEYHVSLTSDDAQGIISEFAKGPGLEKLRHEVKVGEHLWQVDEYLGPLLGLVTAEIELGAESEDFDIPEWTGREITGDTRLSSAVLAEASRDPNGAAQIITLYGVNAVGGSND